MDVPPIPKPRKFINHYENVKKPIPLPRTKELNTQESEQTLNIARQDSAHVPKSEGTVNDYRKKNSNVASDNFIFNAKTTRNRVANSVIEGKKIASKHLNSLTKLHKKKKTVLNVPCQERCVSMSVADTRLFESIQFNSPIKEQKKFKDLTSCQSSSNSSLQLSGTDLNSPYSSETSSLADFPHTSNVTFRNIKPDCSVYDQPRVDSSESSNSWSLYDTVAGINHFALSDIVENKDKEMADPKDDPSVSVSTKKDLRPSQSIMFEFDPLSNYEPSHKFEENTNFSMLQSLLSDETDEKSIFIAENASKEVNISDESDCDFYWDESISYLSPPTPPERLDSLFVYEKKADIVKNRKSREIIEKKSEVQTQSKWFVNSEHDESDMMSQNSTQSIDSNKQANTSMINKFSNILKMVPESASFLKRKIDQGINSNAIPSSLMCPKMIAPHSGKMVRFLPGSIDEIFKNFSLRLCTLTDRKLTFFQDNSNVKEVFNLKNCFSLQIIHSHKFNYDGELYCFQANFSNIGAFNINRGTVIFGCINEGERDSWIRKIVEIYTDVFPSKYITNMTSFGWCYLKEGVSSSWDAAWLLLKQRCLFYYSSQDTNVRCLDLRKARFVVLREIEDKKATNESGLLLLLDLPNLTLYLRMGASRETRLWHRILKSVATNNGSSIHHQQLTKDDIPTIVDKCINFIYTQGSLSVGIYRKAGTNVNVRQLLAEFRADAWAVHLAGHTHSEHDVATVLKRFFRELPESLLTTEIHNHLCAVTELLERENRAVAYKELIENLHPISQNTLRKLLGHLHFIQSLSGENCMTASNLATVWGPTLMGSKTSSNHILQQETEVVFDLIDLYMCIYKPSRSDIEKERKMLAILKQCQSTSNIIQKRSGDLHVWIYLFEKQAGNSVNIVLKPGRTSEDVCKELSSKVSKEAHLLLIEEVVCGECMSRPLHHTEILLDIVLRWGYWDENDRRDNYLVLKENTILQEVAKLPFKSESINMELKFANEKTRSFNLYNFEFKKLNIYYFKDKLCTMPLGCWKVEDIRWYIGHEAKRNPQFKWSITLIERNRPNPRSKDSPWFGCTIAGNTKEDQILWIRALLQAEFSDSILPMPQLICP